MKPFKRCDCGQTFSRAEWDALCSPGIQCCSNWEYRISVDHTGRVSGPMRVVKMEDGPDLELRNCPRCHTTMAREIPCGHNVPAPREVAA
jgi:hypothetical protein